ncbi:major facilitator superfamily domain-containing protein [Lophiotrema nucula]|uniref:Major facilitator superfamily domain-containing protein n=1 Tax=Lophiotrema nucula TaxID=690887 RepID=A0A6A5YHB8_9PLEO|nr:major facilitator superfamily domain-containing protein [Lophiotrema nucula]
MILAFAVFIVSITSSGFSQSTEDMKTEFNVDQTVALLTTSTFVLEFAVGVFILSPLSEVYGRRELYIRIFGAFVGLSVGTGLASNMTVILLLRFFGGLAGSFTQAVAPAVVAEMFAAEERGLVLSIFTLAGLMGQTLGPIISGAAPKSIAQQLRVGVLRPWIMLIYEPIVTLLSLFLSVVHGTLFLLFAAYPIVFQQVRRWPQDIASLPFLALVIDIIISLVYVTFIDQARYARVVFANNGNAPPEARLPPAMLGAATLPIGLSWFAWSNDPSVFWLVSVSAGVLFGFGMVLLYMSLTNYLVDAYLGYAASALAASTVLRSVAGAVFPLFATKMYDSLGIHWASSIPGFLALIFVPCLVAFYKWGNAIKKKTRFGQEAAKIAEMQRG